MIMNRRWFRWWWLALILLLAIEGRQEGGGFGFD